MTKEPDSSSADDLFAEYLFQRESDSPVDFDAYCAKHPDQAESLRKHLEEWDRVRSILNRLGLGGSLASQIRDKYGSGAARAVTLEPEHQEDSGVTSEVLRRLSSHCGSYGRYKLKGEVARGGMGVILRVWDEDLRRNLAMKVILGKGEATSGETPDVDLHRLGRFLEEAQVTGQLDHPGIVPVHELGLDHEGQVYFTMKLVNGRDLKQIIDQVHRQNEEWTLTRALGVLLKVCEAMAYAHDKGVMHRDLKPGNVMVGKFGEVYVMDWGLARVEGHEDTRDLRVDPTASSAISEVRTDRRDSREGDSDSPILTMDGTVIGTPAYMPPEQAAGRLEGIDKRSDVYAVGAMLYHLLTGWMPYHQAGDRPSPHTVLAMVLQGPPKPVHTIRPNAPAELEAICERAMAREPDERYASVEELAEDLRAFVENRVVKAYRTGAFTELKKWIQRNKPLAASLAASFVLSVAGMGTISYVQARGKTAALTARAVAQTNETEARHWARVARRERTNVLKLFAHRILEGIRRDAEMRRSSDTELVRSIQAVSRVVNERFGILESFDLSGYSLAPAPTVAGVFGSEPDAGGLDAWWVDRLSSMMRVIVAADDILSIEGALQQYAVQNIGWPDELGALAAADANGASFLGRTTLPVDAWNRPFVYELLPDSSRVPTVWSYGKDGQRGGEGEDRDFNNITIRNGE